MPHDHPQKELEVSNLGGNMDLEIARLISLERRRIERAGGLFPERENELAGFERVLDIISGVGTWTLNVAQMYPEIEVHGLERHSRMADYASGQAEVRKVGNVSYACLGKDLTRLDFPDNFFDMVNANYLFAMLRPHEWPNFFRECLRITRPGGYIRIFEQDWGITNSPAIEKLADLFLRGLKKANLSLSSNGRYIGVLPLICTFLTQAGWTQIQRRALVDDYLTGPGVPKNAEQAICLMANTMRPITLQQEMATPEVFDALLAQATLELESEDFCSFLLLAAFWARKPECSLEDARNKD